jgi:signal transduction histidine kinase
MRLSLRYRLALLGAVAIVLAVGLAAWGLTALFGEHVQRRAIAEMELQLEQVLAGLALQPQGLVVASPPTDPRLNRPYGGLYWQLRSPGADLRSRSLWDTSLDIPDAQGPSGDVLIHQVHGPNSSTLLAVTRFVTLPSSLGGGALTATVAMETAELSAARSAFASDLAPYLALLALTLIAAQFAQLTLGLRPLGTIGRRVAALRSGEAERMGDDWPSEVRPLAGEIDELLKAREADIERARFRAADLAHGLKTPLQALLGEASRLRDRNETASADAIDDISRTMQAHVERELARARVSSRPKHTVAVVATAAEQIVSVLRRTPDGASIVWAIGIPRHLSALIDPSDLAEALGALAENAMRHARSKVTVSASERGDLIQLQILDDGPGIPDHQLAAVMERGRRLDETASGNGLGLAIAREIAVAVGGDIRLENVAGGFAASLILPRSPRSRS